MGHNFGDISFTQQATELVPVFLLKLNIIWALKTRFVWPMTYLLAVRAGCKGYPGRLLFAFGDAKLALVIGAETLSGFVIPMIGIPCCMLMEWSGHP